MVKDTGYGLLRFSKKTGKVDMLMTCIGSAQLDLWGLQNTTKTKESIVIDLEDGKILSHYIGDESGFPKVDKKAVGKQIDDNIRMALAEDFNS